LIEIGSSLSVSDWLFHATHGSTILKFYQRSEIVAIDIDGNIDILGAQIRAGWIIKALDFAARQD
jgi:hypothetical protein